ncbi:MAG: FAD:protein FMN transferase [Candidatus Pacebacteria bacterium]|nr:FAD:protein FMN transferase [Candidatus Paceibacterota bacterium]MCF7857689.1 FAD:protein FMN transferase [Candidatus Paceibacterota bacterium]
MHEYEHTGMAMGTEISIAIITSSKDDAERGFKHALTTIREYEEKFSRFRQESELSRLNMIKKMPVSPIFLVVLKEALELSKKTQMAFNPLVQVSRLGYSTSFVEITNTTPRSRDEPYDTDIAKIHIDPHTNIVTLAVGQKLDFGGFLKGYLAEKLAKKLEVEFPSYHGVIVNLGGDLHTRGLDEYGKKFVFEIYNPVTTTDESCILYNQSLATSGTYKRTWQTSDGKKHHILDTSGKKNPSTDIVSASVIHANGAESEAYAKTFLLFPFSEALNIIKDPTVSYLLITHTGIIIKNI